MGSRPLRHFYNDEDVRLEVDSSLGSVIDPWTRHRERFLDELASLADEQWLTESRCDGWTNRDVICHLLDVDAFWMLSLESGRAGTPTSYLASFNPTDTPLDLVNARAGTSTAEVYDQFAGNTKAFCATVESFADGEWDLTSESPVGHVSSRLTLAHALWDSWLHEWDVLGPLGLAPHPEPDELRVVTWYSLFFGAAQGGLIGDQHPVGPGATEPIDAELRFDEFDQPLRILIDTDVTLGSAGDAKPAGSAMSFVEALSGRTETFPPEAVALPSALAAHLARARQIL
jgi:uncharacterized protein (TIGR03083 family)